MIDPLVVPHVVPREAARLRMPAASHRPLPKLWHHLALCKCMHRRAILQLLGTRLGPLGRSFGGLGRDLGCSWAGKSIHTFRVTDGESKKMSKKSVLQCKKQQSLKACCLLQGKVCFTLRNCVILTCFYSHVSDLQLVA